MYPLSVTHCIPVLFHCYMLSVCHFKGVGFILSLLFYFYGNRVRNQCRP